MTPGYLSPIHGRILNAFSRQEVDDMGPEPGVGLDTPLTWGGGRRRGGWRRGAPRHGDDGEGEGGELPEDVAHPQLLQVGVKVVAGVKVERPLHQFQQAVPTCACVMVGSGVCIQAGVGLVCRKRRHRATRSQQHQHDAPEYGS